MKKLLRALLLTILLLLLTAAALWFLPMPPGLWGWQEPSAGYTGAFAQNAALDPISLLYLGGYSHPETVQVRDGWIYVTVRGGVLLRMREDGSQLTTLLDTGGCFLGFDFAPDGSIFIADCDYGGTGALLRFSIGGSPQVLLSKAQGLELFYPNGLAIAADGTVYLSDSSSAFPPARFGGDSSRAAANESMMHTCTGRVIAYHPATDKAEVIAQGLAFANGLGLNADESALFICETYAYAIQRLDLATGKLSPFLSGLPGFPDNLVKGAGGRFWVGFNGQRSDALDSISGRPFLRKCIWLYNKLTGTDESASAGYSHVFAFTEDGTVAPDLQSGINGYPRTTGAAETPERLYLSSINSTGKLAYVELDDLPMP